VPRIVRASRVWREYRRQAAARPDIGDFLVGAPRPASKRAGYYRETGALYEAFPSLNLIDPSRAAIRPEQSTLKSVFKRGDVYRYQLLFAGAYPGVRQNFIQNVEAEQKEISNVQSAIGGSA